MMARRIVQINYFQTTKTDAAVTENVPIICQTQITFCSSAKPNRACKIGTSSAIDRTMRGAIS